MFQISNEIINNIKNISMLALIYILIKNININAKIIDNNVVNMVVNIIVSVLIAVLYCTQNI